MSHLTDDSLMPFGKHKGTRMEDVPAKYLDWLDGEGIKGPVKDYIDSVREILNAEMEDE